MNRPNILYIMCDQFRADCIASLGNSIIETPNIDRLVKRGIIFTKAYSTCPVCIPARYTIRTGCEPYNTGSYQNGVPVVPEGVDPQMEKRCGKYLARTMTDLGYRTFGIGKFHTVPWDEEVGFETQLHSEETYDAVGQRSGDAFASFIAHQHPEFSFIEQLHGERTEMYYMPQTSPLPAELTVESWAADHAVEHISKDDGRPYFGFVSFIGPHPPVAPPIPFNRMYDPDCMPNPVKGELQVDHADEQIPWMNYMIWAEDINDSHARVLKARYYAEITYIDQCIGRILDAVEARADAENTLICFFSDHGDHMGDHHAWQKESFFEASCHVPFLLSWPERFGGDLKKDDLVCLTDLFGIAANAAGHAETRDGIDVLGMLEGKAEPRKYLYGYYGAPGTSRFKIMVRYKDWKYVYMANGSREQLFNIKEDPHELEQLAYNNSSMAAVLRNAAEVEMGRHTGLMPGLQGSCLKGFDYSARPYRRIHQFDASKGIKNFTKSLGKNSNETKTISNIYGS